jgi:protein-S-isoprenylcysteine O-methyltransferase Ste14
MTTEAGLGTTALWAVVGVVWLVTALGAKPAVKRQAVVWRIGDIALLALAFTLVLSSRLAVGPLGVRWLAENDAASLAGFAVTLAGAILTVWARLRLGRNWSGVVAVQADHELVSSGPYAVVRHPVYAGLLLALIGTAIATGEVGGLIGVGLAALGFGLRMRLEEQYLTGLFGPAYVAYRRRVKAVVPFVL